MTSDQPPAIQAINAIELVATVSSKITAVSVYSGRAEVTRVFTFDVKTGQNQVTITGLPNVLDHASLRVEGRGSATIHDVAVSTNRRPAPPPPTTSPVLSSLAVKKEKSTKALQRAKKSLVTLEAYMDSMDTKTIPVTQVREVIEEYNTTAEDLDNRVLGLEAELRDIEEESKSERERLVLNTSRPNDKLNTRAVIGVFADVEGEVEIILIYAVNGASWTAFYDVRVDTNARREDSEPVKLIYKAGITQSTGEDWTNVSLTLETATPTFGLGVPKLDTWELYRRSSLGQALFTSYSSAAPGAPPPPPPPPQARTYSHTPAAPPPRIVQRTMDVSSKGAVSATFQVPGLITVPSDGVVHNVTIVELRLGATMSWVCVPKIDTKVHISAKIKNSSQYTLLSGEGSIYIDGSFTSRSRVPSVSPEASFDCPLGLDPSIHITYHPRTHNRSERGFYSKAVAHVYKQLVTVQNTKPIPISNVRVEDQIPVSEDAQIQVKLVAPALVRQQVDKADLTVEGKSTGVVVAENVRALWQGVDAPEPDADVDVLGTDGKFYWVCEIPAQGKVNLTLQWEVVAPAQERVYGL
ncbi:hypothetical protein H0H92_008404 [Tricholoma furcatifolium]|nr:hypothetical protein H0H92_008404 [Tricholoma furcatifolium]